MDKYFNNWPLKTEMQNRYGESKFKQTQFESKKEDSQRPHQKQTLFNVQCQKIGHATYYLQEWNPHNKLDLALMVKQ